MNAWNAQGLGIKWMTLLLDNANEGPPDATGAKQWKDTFGLHHAIVAADPNFSMVPGQSVGTPQFTIIDPRTMTVTFLQEGAGGNEYTQLEQLAMTNKTNAGL